jgi:predicted nucleic acid-binding protein
LRQAAYADSSALVKLAVAEPESEAVLRWFTEAEIVVTSRIGLIETRRSVARVPHDAEHLLRALAEVAVMEVDIRVAEAAARVRPPGLRTLDAIHLASAIEMGPALDAFVTYDDRLALAARSLGLPVVRPS